MECYHELIVAVVICTGLAQDEASQNSSMDLGGLMRFHP